MSLFALRAHCRQHGTPSWLPAWEPPDACVPSGMAGRPRLLRFVKKRSNFGQVQRRKYLGRLERRFQRVLLATFQIRFSSSKGYSSSGPTVLTSTHLAPSLCEPGRVGHPLLDFQTYKEPSNFCRNSWRPRAKRDFTVPTLIPRVSAISS